MESITVAPENKFFDSKDGVLYTKDMKTIVAYPIGKKSVSFVIPSGVTKIEAGAFYECTTLKNITIPKSVIEIGDSAFSCTALKSVTIPNNVTKIGEETFSYTELESITIPDSVTEIGYNAFSFCKALKNIILPNSVIEIGNGAFSECTALESVTIPTHFPLTSQFIKDKFPYCPNLHRIFYGVEMYTYSQ